MPSASVLTLYAIQHLSLFVFSTFSLICLRLIFREIETCEKTNMRISLQYAISQLVSQSDMFISTDRGYEKYLYVPYFPMECLLIRFYIPFTYCQAFIIIRRYYQMMWNVLQSDLVNKFNGVQILFVVTMRSMSLTSNRKKSTKFKRIKY